MNDEMIFEKSIYHYRFGTDIMSNKTFDQQKKETSFLLKQHFSKAENLHFLIGSGCSLPAIPLMGKTFLNIKESNPQLRDVLGKYDGSNADIEGFLNYLKTTLIVTEPDSIEYVKFEDAFNITKKELLRSIVVNYFPDSSSDQEGERNAATSLKHYLEFYNRLFYHREFNKQLSPVNIFTTNYDLFNEIAMEQLGIHYTNGFQGYVNRTFDPSIFNLRLVDAENRYKDKWNAIRRYIKLYKIHGSVDWRYDQHLKSIRQSEFSLDNTGEVIIYPTVHKHFESQQSPYSELFREFSLNLQKKNSTLIVMGYGFPDDHINQLISQSLHNEDFTLIIFGNKNEVNASNFLKKHKNRHNIHFIGGSINNMNDAHYFSNIIELLGEEIDDAKPE